MIIQCDRCSTKFRLDDAKVSERGVKVRCTKCQNVFIVTPPPTPPEEAHIEEITGAQAPAYPPSGKESPLASNIEKPPALKENLRFDFSPAEEKAPEPKEAPPVSSAPLTAAPGKTTEPPAPATVPPPPPPAPKTAPKDEGEETAPPLSFKDVDLSFHIEKSIQETLGKKEQAVEKPPLSKPGAKGAPDEAKAPPLDKGKPLSEEKTGAKSTADLDFDLEGRKGEEDKGRGGEVDSWKIIEDEEGVRAVKVSPPAKDSAGKGEGLKPETPAAPPSRLPYAPSASPAKPLEEKTASEKAAKVREDFSRILSEALKEGTAPKHEDAEALTGIKAERAGAAAGAGLEGEGEGVAGGTRTGVFGEAVGGVGGVKEGGFAAPGAVQPRRANRLIGLVVAVLIIVGGGWALHYTGVIDAITGFIVPGEKTAASGKAVEIESIKAYISENRNFGKVFVIEATIRNVTDEPKKIKGIRGAIYDRGGTRLRDRTVSPGRVATPEDLKNLTRDELMKNFRDSSGGVIPPRGTVPVMVPFTEIPPETSEYGIDVIL